MTKKHSCETSCCENKEVKCDCCAAKSCHQDKVECCKNKCNC